MKSYINKIFSVLCVALALSMSSCINDLDLTPNDPNQITGGNLKPEDLAQVFAKCYSSLAVAGQNGPDGASDISGLDGGTSQYTRAIYMMNEFTTDETKWIWPDAGVFDLVTNTWGANNPNIYGTYSRLFVHIAVCNDFLKLTGGTADPTVQQYRLEARALRAMSYYHVIDLFGNGGFIDENGVGSSPVQKPRADLYAWLVTELKDIAAAMPTTTPIYGRVGIDGVEALLARTYLNAKVYTNGAVDGYADCAATCERIIARHQGGGFQGSGLAAHYLYVFCGSNNVYMPGGGNTAENEILWGIPFDSDYIKTYGGSMFLCAANLKNMTWAENDAYMNAADYGMAAQWGCMHATAQFADKFQDNANDVRWSMWCKEDNGFIKENTGFSNFTDGYGVVKFTNLLAGTDGKWDVTSEPGRAEPFPDTDLPLIRLADVYLMYAESNIVGGAGNSATALTYVNYVRNRANAGAWTAADMTADNILDERCRELYWENVRRTDLIRFGKFTGGKYIWNWKGNTNPGKSIEAYRDLFPIPSNVIAVQPDFKQNPGY